MKNIIQSQIKSSIRLSTYSSHFSFIWLRYKILFTFEIDLELSRTYKSQAEKISQLSLPNTNVIYKDRMKITIKKSNMDNKRRMNSIRY